MPGVEASGWLALVTCAQRNVHVARVVGTKLTQHVQGKEEGDQEHKELEETDEEIGAPEPEQFVMGLCIGKR